MKKKQGPKRVLTPSSSGSDDAQTSSTTSGSDAKTPDVKGGTTPRDPVESASSAKIHLLKELSRSLKLPVTSQPEPTPKRKSKPVKASRDSGEYVLLKPGDVICETLDALKLETVAAIMAEPEPVTPEVDSSALGSSKVEMETGSSEVKCENPSDSEEVKRETSKISDLIASKPTYFPDDTVDMDSIRMSDKILWRSKGSTCMLCPMHSLVMSHRDAVMTADALTSFGGLSSPSNMDVFRTSASGRIPTPKPSGKRRTLTSPPRSLPVSPSKSSQPLASKSPKSPQPSASEPAQPSTSKSQPTTPQSPAGSGTGSSPSRRFLSESGVIRTPPQSPQKSSVASPSSPSSPGSDYSITETPIRSFFGRIMNPTVVRCWKCICKILASIHLDICCCCGMGMKLRCFEGNSGAGSYFLLEDLAGDKDSSTEKQEELQFFDDNGSYVSVVVEKNLRAIDLTQLLAVKNRVRKDYCWSIVEHWVDFGIERVLEDQEDVLSVHRQTEGGAKKYIFRRFPNKYDFFSKPEEYFPPDMLDLKTYQPGYMYPENNPDQLERVLTTAEELPVIFSQVNLRQEKNSNIWIKTFLLLKDSKILMSSKVQVVAKFLRAWRESSSGYRTLNEGDASVEVVARETDYVDEDLERFASLGEANDDELEVLADLKDYEVYTSLNAKNHLRGPTEFGVVLRKTNEDDFADPVVLSFDKGKDRVCWVTAMRLAKYGKQLRENYKAFKNKQETISNNGGSATINESVRSRVAMDFTGKVGRIVDDPMEAKAIAVSEGNAWKKRLRAKAEASKHGNLPIESGEEEKSHYSQPWYHKGMSREQANILLNTHGKHDGVFVVRGSRSQPGGNVLSVKTQEKVIHIPIMLIEDQLDKVLCYTIDNGVTKFYDICQLVEFYRLNTGPLPARLSNHLEKAPHKVTGSTSRTESH